MSNSQQPTAEAPISRALSCLEATTSDINEHLDKLRAQLAFVLSPAIPPPEEEGVTEVEDANGCDMEKRVRATIGHEKDVIHKIKDTISRLRL